MLCDTDTLNTLPYDIFRDGCAEVIKYGVLYDPALFAHLSEHGMDFDREKVITRCVELKRDVVAEDEFDTGARMKLNLGHTIGHGVEVGGKKLAVIAGPCSVESEEQIAGVAKAVQKSGACALRGGAYKPRTSPYAFQGMGLDGLRLLNEARQATGLPIVTELMSADQLPIFEECVDVIQIGARNMQNFDLLKKVGKTRKPVLLKRGLSSTIEEWLMSAEYIMAGGNEQVILCERGVRTFETYTRNTLDLSAVLAVKSVSHLPVGVDPSHACGRAWMVERMAMAAVAAGADGLIIEVHNDPKNALCDGAQSITPEQFDALMGKLKPIAECVGREV